VSRRVLVAGTVGSALVALGGAIVGTAPIHHGRPPDWFGYVAAYAGLAVLVAAWLALGAAVLRGDDGPARAGCWHHLIAWSAPLALGAPLYSRDVYSYIAQGRMAQLGINPYVHGPISLGQGRYLDAVSHVWQRTPAPYGPLFVGIASLITRATPVVMTAAFGMRLAALVGVALLAVFLPRLARQNGVPEQVAWWLGMLNPLVLLHLVAGGHNDALMLGLMVAGLAVAGDGRTFAGIFLCTVAAAVKVPALLAVGYLAVELVWSRPTWSARGRTALGVVAVVASVFVAITEMVGFGWGWVSAMGTPGRINTMLAPSRALGALLSLLGVDDSTRLGRIVGVAAGLVVLQLLFRLRVRLGWQRMLAVSLLTVVVFGPVVQPWYLLWGLTLLAAAGPGRLLTSVVWVSAVLPFLVMPNGSSAHDAVLLVFVVVTAGLAYVTLSRPADAPFAPAEPT
jgi:hypothetical protein